MPTSDELADALFDSKDAHRRFVPKLAWITRDELRALARDAAKQALLDAANELAAQRDETNPERSPDDGWSVIDHSAGRFLGKTVAIRLLRARAEQIGEGK